MITASDSRLSFYSSVTAGICTILFAGSLFNPDLIMFSFAVCILLALSFVLLTVSNDKFTREEHKVYSRTSISFAVIYCTLVCIVYYVQISFVRLGSPSQGALSIVAYAPPKTAFFALNILGYFFMSLSALFLAFTINSNKLLKTLLVIDGVVGASGIIVPLLPFFYSGEDQSSSAFGVIALLVWSAMFIPICVLLAIYFRQSSKKPS